MYKLTVAHHHGITAAPNINGDQFSSSVYRNYPNRFQPEVLIPLTVCLMSDSSLLKGLWLSYLWVTYVVMIVTRQMCVATPSLLVEIDVNPDEG